MKSVMEHQFSQVPRADIPRSSFNRSHGLKTTFDADYLIPIFVEDVIPGSSHNVKASFFARLATPLHPIMDNMYLDTFFFFVPYRLVWDNWEKFCGAQDDPGDSIDYTIPVLTGANTATDVGMLWDYFGLPVPGTALDPDDVGASALPYRATALIWNDWFRDQNLQDSLNVETDDGPDTISEGNKTSANYIIRDPQKRGKRHDYFTSALPWPQKGSAVSMPLGTQAPVTGIGVPTSASFTTTNTQVHDSTGSSFDTYVDTWNASASNTYIEENPDAAGYPNIYADLTNATASTINDIRLAFQTQRLLERDARSGTRYVETLKAHFGVTSPDFRLQRPEFLGGGSSRVNITPVANQSPVLSASNPAQGAGDINQGDLSGYGTVSGTHSFTKSFVEHGVIIGFANARADLTYSQGVERYWTKSTRYDFYYPVLSNIGEQSILNKELWADGSANDELVFGYTERYNEYRYKPSKLTGLMRPDVSGTLASWHLSEDFATLPTLGSDFITANLSVPLDRAIAVTSEPHFIADFYFDYKCAQPMPMYGIPGSLDHF